MSFAARWSASAKVYDLPRLRRAVASGCWRRPLSAVLPGLLEREETGIESRTQEKTEWLRILFIISR
jgi:hypothetical protein